jgi:group II intron reverse transcriptase/maturase
LSFAFADSPKGGEESKKLDESGGRDFLLHTAKTKEAIPLGATTGDTHSLLERVASPANLASALLHVARRKGAPGVDGESVGDVVRHARATLPRIRQALLQETYVPGDVRRVWIPKLGGGRRGLGIPNVVDRWVQQAVHQVLEPVFDPSFHDCSHGFRSGRGAQTALADVRRHLTAGHVWLVNIDLSKFFDRVNHQRLLARMASRVSDKRVLKLVHRCLKAQVVMPDGVRVSTDEGTPQGGPLSPILSNIVLDELDWELERRGLRFVRYADDFIVFVRSERAAYRVMDSITRYIESRLRLKVNRDKSAVTGPDDTHFLGFRFQRNPDGTVETLLSKRSVDRLQTRIRELTPRQWGQSLAACLEGLNAYFRGWMSHFRLLSAAGTSWFRGFESHARRRLRSIIIRQKKRARHLYRHLLSRGVSPRAASGTAFRSRGIWKRSHTPGIERAYPNAWFAERMASLTVEWSRLQPPRLASRQLLLFE